MNEVLYQQLIPADYAEYRRIRLDCLKQYPDNFGGTHEEELTADSLKLAGAIKAADAHNFVFGAFTLERRLIGICGVITSPGTKSRHRCEIVQLFVDPSYNGYGIGKKLLLLSLDKAFESGQIELIILSVVSVNEKAIALYRKFGFKEYGRLERYFLSGAEYFTQTFLYLAKKKQPG